ncbi:MAG: hypothetical protein IT306_17990 [Chloroflexi bacterium]|nr:hypothetical protein [Chloroflexota bacterium]
MRCVRCGHDSKKKDRSNKACPACKGRFAFEPQDGAKLTDLAFLHAIERVSGQGKVRWTADHLYYEVCRRLRPRALRMPTPGEWIGVGVLVVILGVVFAFSRWAGLFILVVAGLGALGSGVRWLRGRRRLTPPLTREQFAPMLHTWVQAHGTPPGLIERPALPSPSRPRRQLEADIGDYSFDRAVICDRPETVDLLLANNFHFENNCAILTADGYPPAPFETVRAMLKRNPKLRVFALHDATVDGCQLAHRLSNDPSWFLGQAPVVDVGLRPGQAGPFRGVWLATPQAAVLTQEGISEREAEWLRQYSLELAAIRPDQVLKRLFRAMNRQPDEDDDDEGGGSIVLDEDDMQEGIVIEDEESFGSDADADDGGADSFG